MPSILIPRKPVRGELWAKEAIEVYCLYEDPEHYHAYISVEGRWFRKAFLKSYWKIFQKKDIFLI